MEKILLNVQDISTSLAISKALAYQIIRKCNEELKGNGFIIVSGRVPKKFFQEKFYGFKSIENQKEYE